MSFQRKILLIMLEIRIVSASLCLNVSGQVDFRNGLTIFPTVIDFEEKSSRLLEILFVITKTELFIVAILQMSEKREVSEVFLEYQK